MNRRSFALVFSASAIALSGFVSAAAPRSAFAQAAAAPVSPVTPRIADHVFIVSFDGGKPAVMKESRMPTFMKMMQEGAGTWEASTIFPSITLTSHTSMLTGVGPEKHKVLWNEWVPEKGMVTVPTIFSLAKKQDKNISTAMFVGKQKFAHLFLPGSLNGFSMPSYSAKIVARQAADYIQQEKPNLCFIHFADSDGAGHQYGWGTPQQIQAFADEDQALAVVRDAIKRAGIEKTSLVILTADHGGHAKTHGTRSAEDMIIPWVIWGAGVKKNFTITTPVTTYDSAATALYALGVALPAEFDGKPVVSAFLNAPAGATAGAAAMPGAAK
ncbi:MAG: alkaline phosphatase family protein [Armatimonadota bacterium]